MKHGEYTNTQRGASKIVKKPVPAIPKAKAKSVLVEVRNISKIKFSASTNRWDCCQLCILSLFMFFI